jgi:recombination protein RecR
MSRPDPLARLIEQLQRLPGIGAKSAARLAFHLLKTPREEVERLVEAVREVKDRVTYCSICSNITDTDPCYFCTHPTRDHRLICVVEEPENVTAIEKTRDFKGVYHVLMGALSPLHGVGPDDLKIRELLGRVGNGGVEGDQPERRRRGNRDLSGEAAEASRRACHANRDGRPGRQRPRIRRRGDDAQGDGGTTGTVMSP